MHAKHTRSTATQRHEPGEDLWIVLAEGVQFFQVLQDQLFVALQNLLR